MNKLHEWFTQARAVKKRHEKGVLSQFAEIARLRAGPGRIGPGDYYAYRLYDDRSLDWPAKKTFVGWRAEPMVDSLNERAWHSVANDKLVFAAVMFAADVATPRTLAIFHAAGRRFFEARTLRTRSDLAKFLRDEIAYPFFSKPVAGGVGRGAVFVRAYHSGDDSLELGNGSRVGLEHFVGKLRDPGGFGHLFQEVVVPHAQILRRCGPRLCTARVMVVLAERGPAVHRVAWRIACGTNMIDNFAHGSSGNLVADVDPADGLVRRVISGFGESLTEVRRHPDTGADLVGMRLPDWNAALAMVYRGAESLPGLRFQHWDLAFSDRGPLALEVNLYDPGATDFSQILGRGVLDGEVATLLGNR